MISRQWEMTHVPLGEVNERLDAGWEPFAVTDGPTVWLKRATRPGPPRNGDGGEG